MSILMDSNLLSVEELALYLGRSKSSIYTMVNRGQLPYIKLGKGKNGSLRFDSEEIKTFLESRKVEALHPIEREALHV